MALSTLKYEIKYYSPGTKNRVIDNNVNRTIILRAVIYQLKRK